MSDLADPAKAAGAGPPSDSVSEAMWLIYVFGGKGYLPRTVRTERGATVSIGPVAIMDASDSAAVAEAILAEVARNVPVIPEPDWSDLEPEVILAAGTRNFTGFMGWGLIKQGGKFYVAHVQMEPNAAYVSPVTTELPHADPADAAKLIATEIAESQLPGQTKYVPAKSRAKPKPVELSDSAAPTEPDVEPEAVPGELTIEQLAATAPKGKRPTEAQVAALEATLPRPLPPDYRRFLLLCNGEFDYDRLDENEENVVSWFYTLTRVKPLRTLEQVRDRMQDPDDLRISEEVLPIGDDGCGNAICIGLTGKHRGKIFLWDHESEPDPATWDGTVKGSGNTEIIAESFTALVGKMKLK